MSVAHLVSSGLSSGSLAAFPLVLLGGLVSALNPCCLSMAPTIVALVGSGPARNSRSAMILSALFVCGFAATTAIMGAASVAFGLVFGYWAKPLVYLSAFIPLVMALKLWGVIEFQVPSLQTALMNGRLGAAAAGACFAFVIAPCATPVLASILAFAATTHSIVYGTSLLFIYGIGLGVPLIAAGSLLGSLPMLHKLRPAINSITAFSLTALGLYLLWKV